MSHVTFAAPSRYQIYDLDLPHRIPGFAVGFAITKFKQIGVWSKLPPALRAKAKDAGMGRRPEAHPEGPGFRSGRCLGNDRTGIERALEIRDRAQRMRPRARALG